MYQERGNCDASERGIYASSQYGVRVGSCVRSEVRESIIVS